LSALAAVGLAMLVRRRAWTMLFIILISLGMTWAWPWPDQFYRFLVPLTPFLIIGVMMFFFTLISALSTPRVRPVVTIPGRIVLGIILAVALAVEICSVLKFFYNRGVQRRSFVPVRVDGVAHFFYCVGSWRAWPKPMAWMQNPVTPNSTVVTRSPELCAL